MGFLGHSAPCSGPSNLCVASNFAIGVAVGLVVAHFTSCPVVQSKKKSSLRKAGKMTLSYFDIPALGEPIRLLLSMGKFDWEDNTVQFSEWKNLKSMTKWGQMPVVRTASGLELTQTKAIVRYLGKLVTVNGQKLYPDCPDIAFEADEMIEAFEDVRNKLVPTFKIQDQAEKEKARKDLFKEGGEANLLLKKIESFAGEEYMVANQTTVADLWCFWFCGFIKSGFFDGLDASTMNSFKKLERISAKFGSLSEVKSYYSKIDTDKKPAYKAYQY